MKIKADLRKKEKTGPSFNSKFNKNKKKWATLKDIFQNIPSFGDFKKSLK